MRSRWIPTRPFIFLIIFLVIAGLTLITIKFDAYTNEVRQHVIEHANKENRVPPWDAVVYTPLYLEYLQKNKPDKPMLGLFGPSTVYGTTVRKGSNTTAGVIQEQHPEYQVMNLGLTGARFTETYAILAAAIEQVDYIVFELNYGIVVLSDKEPDVNVYPQLINKLETDLSRQWLDEFPEKNKDSFPSMPHRWFQQKVLNKWSLYKHRDVITYKNFKTRTPQERLRKLTEEWNSKLKAGKEPGPSLMAAYVSMTPNQQKSINEHFKDLYNWEQPFDPDHSFGMFMIEQVLKLLKEHNKPALFYTAPLDRELIDQEQLLDWEQYNQVMETYKAMIESYQFSFVDFNKEGHPMPHTEYHDPSHLLDDGSHQFGQLLLQKVNDYLLP